MMFLLSGSSSCYLSMLVLLSHSSSELELCQNFTAHVVPWLEQVSGIAGSHCICSQVYFLIGSMQHAAQMPYPSYSTCRKRPPGQRPLASSAMTLPEDGHLSDMICILSLISSYYINPFTPSNSSNSRLLPCHIVC